MRLAVVLGVRPHHVKITPLARLFGDAGIEALRIHTAQHRDPGPAPGEVWALGQVRLAPVEGMTDRLNAFVQGIVDSVDQTACDAVLSIGDTDTTLAAARAADFSGLPFVHVEHLGRLGPDDQPESRNRKEIEALTGLGLTPLPECSGPAFDQVWSGDLLLDAFLQEAPAAQADRSGPVLATLHRAELFQSLERLDRVIDGLIRLQRPVHIPAHPAKADTLADHIAKRHKHKVKIRSPLARDAFLEALQRAPLCITDSGGVTREALFAGTPVIHAGVYTAWQGAGGTQQPLVWDPDHQSLPDTPMLPDANDIAGVHRRFGGGQAAQRIVEAVLARYGPKV